MKDLLLYMAKSLVDDPDSVTVTEASPAPKIAAASAQTAPPMNQTETSATVAASAAMKTTMAISHPITS